MFWDKYFLKYEILLYKHFQNLCCSSTKSISSRSPYRMFMYLCICIYICVCVYVYIYVLILMTFMWSWLDLFPYVSVIMLEAGVFRALSGGCTLNGLLLPGMWGRLTNNAHNHTAHNKCWLWLLTGLYFKFIPT